MRLKHCLMVLISGLFLFMQSCLTTSYFKTSNNVYKKDGVINLIDGKTIQGKITILFENGLDPVNHIMLNRNGKDEKVLIDDIAFYTINSEVYVPKLVDFDNSKTQKILFLKQLSKENSKIQLLELYQQANISKDGVANYFYFIVTASQTRFEALSLTSAALVPNFDNKMAKLVKDCPVLADKIREKTKGYFIASITFSNYKTLDVLNTIINEYNACQ